MSIQVELDLHPNAQYLESEAKENTRKWNEAIAALSVNRTEEAILSLEADDYYFSGPIHVTSNLTIQTGDGDPSQPKAELHFARVPGENTGKGDADQSAGLQVPNLVLGDLTGKVPEEDWLENLTIRSLEMDFVTPQTDAVDSDELRVAALFINLDHSTVMGASPSLITLGKASKDEYQAYQLGRNILLADLELNGQTVGKNGIQIGGLENVTIENCSVQKMGYLAGISVEYSKNVVIRNNTIEDVGRAGIQIYRGNQHVTVDQNSVKNWMQRYGVYHLLQVSPNQMFDGGIDSYGPHNYDLIWTRNEVRIPGNVERDAKDRILTTQASQATDPEVNPCNPVLRERFQAKFDAANGKLTDKMMERYRSIMKTPHALYTPYRLSGARKVRMEGNKGLVRSRESANFLFTATRTVDSRLRVDGKLHDYELERLGIAQPDKVKVTGFASDVIVKDNDFTIEGEVKQPLRIVAAKQDLYASTEQPDVYGQLKMKSQVNAGEDATQMGVELLNNRFTLHGRIHSQDGYQPEESTEQAKANYYQQARVATLQLGNSNDLTASVSRSTNKVEEALLHRNTFTFNPPACDTFEAWSFPRFGVLGSPEDITEQDTKVVETCVTTQNAFRSDVADAPAKDQFQEVYSARIKHAKATLFTDKGFPSYEIGGSIRALVPATSRVAKVGVYRVEQEAGEDTYTLLRGDLLTAASPGVTVDNEQVFVLSNLPDRTEEDDIRLCAFDPYDNMIEARPIYLTKLTVQPVHTGETTLTGTYDATLIKNIVIFRNGVYQSWNKVNMNPDTGTYSFSILAADRGDTFEVWAKDPTNLNVGYKWMQVLPNYQFRVREVYEVNQQTLAFEKGKDLKQVKILLQNGATTQEFGPVTLTGSTLDMTPYLAAITINSHLQICPLNEQGLELEPISVTIADYQIAPTPFVIGSPSHGIQLRGSCGKTLTSLKLLVNGETAAEVKPVQGQFEFGKSLTTAIKVIEDSVEIEGYVGSVKKQDVKVPLTTGYTLDAGDIYTVGSLDSIRGTFGPYIRAVRLWINGGDLPKAAINRPDQNNRAAYGEPFHFEFTEVERQSLDQVITSTTDQVELVAVNYDYKEQARVRVPLTEEQQGLTFGLDKAKFSYGIDQFIRGTMGSRIQRIHLLVDGELVKSLVFLSEKNQIVETDHVHQTVNTSKRINEQVAFDVPVEPPKTFSFDQLTDLIVDPESEVEVQAFDAGFIERGSLPVPIDPNYDTTLELVNLRNASMPLNQYRIEVKAGTAIDKVRIAYATAPGGYPRQFVQDLTAEEDGRYVIWMKDLPNFDQMAVGQTVQIYGVSSWNKHQTIEESIKEVTLTDRISNEIVLTSPPFVVGTSRVIAGTKGADVVKVRFWVNGEVKTQARDVGVDGFTLPNAGNFIQSLTDEVELVAVNSQFQIINRLSVQLQSQ